VSNSLQAWSAGVPVLLVEAMLGIDPDVPAGASGARSVVPGTEVLAISDVALAGGSMTVRARGSEIELVEIRSDLGPG
jgi:glycogen debranching enzyme